MPHIAGVVAGTSDGPAARSGLDPCRRRAWALRPDFLPVALLRRQMLHRPAIARRRGGPGLAGRRGLAVCAAHVSAQNPGRDSQGETKEGDDRRELLLRYVREVEPQVMEEFMLAAPTQVIEAMQHTLTNMLGSLPPQFFDVRISTMGENISQLMYTVILTGYMFRNAQYRLELHRSLGLLPSGDEDFDMASEGPYASTAQKTKVQGDVVRWNKETGPETMSAVQYMEQLEEEIKMLRGQVEQQRTEIGANDLLEYIKGLDGPALKSLGVEGAGEEVLLAMNIFIQRLMGTSDNTELRTTSCDSTAIELARLLYWLMVVGYNLRTLEVRSEMDWTYNAPTLGPPDDV
ncbi:unnamed protein product [Ostreobium quekettii]|uniref:Uncharacterized protein n=1 Tax=Ostreobium quekettii TaxID=121088 RepID=A0A8S1J4V8_9CHLO|nr:unnamed protein product [Ostreobium quekettii]